MMGDEGLVLEPKSLWSKLKQKAPNKEDCIASVVILVVISFFIGLFYLAVVLNEKEANEKKNYVPDITIPSMDLTVFNITDTRLSVKGDLTIRIPYDLPGYYICLKGDFQVFILYKGVTIATSSIESYNLVPQWAQVLNVSSIASKEDIDGMLVKDVMVDIKERGEIRFGSRLVLSDCRYGTHGKMNYACDEDTLRFTKPDSQRNATLVANNVPTCHYVR